MALHSGYSISRKTNSDQPVIHVFIFLAFLELDMRQGGRR